MKKFFKILFGGNTIKIEKQPEKVDSYEIANDLIKEATSLKNTDINAAINKIKEALVVHPELHNAHSKMVGYLKKAGNIEGAYEVINNQIFKYKKDSFNFFDVQGRGTWINQKCSLELFEKKHNEYVKSYFLSVYFDLLSASISGEIDDIKDINKKFKDKVFDRDFAKVLSTIDNGSELINGFTVYLKEKLNHFTNMAKIYNRTDFYKLMGKDAMAGKNTDGDYEFKVLSNNKAFCDEYKNVTETKFSNFIEEKIVVLL